MPIREKKTTLYRLLVLILRPAVRFSLRHSLRLQDLIECVKLAFIDAATRELENAKRKPNVSRLSVMTGVHRRDVLRIQKSGPSPDSDRDIITRLMGQWRTDRRFVTKSGEPRVLTIGGDDSEFSTLCRTVSKDFNPGTLLFELQRIGAIEEARGGVRLLHSSYVPRGDTEAGFSILADDMDTLLDTVEENVFDPGELPQLHARTAFDNVRPDSLPEIQRWLLKEGHEFHARVRTLVGQHDQDINPSSKFKGKGVRVVFGSFGNVWRKR